MITLYDYQAAAVDKMHNGCILCGGVGSGKSITALAYYYTKICGGKIAPKCISGKNCPLYIITTARKRDTKEWEKEIRPFRIKDYVVDSWNNIKKYVNATNSFFIFDEQRVVGSGAWSKAFIKITRQNRWVLLSATPGDTWMDYIPVFIANGFVKNRTEFERKYVVYNRFSKFPKIDRYLNQDELKRFRSKIVVNMNYRTKAEQKHLYLKTYYDHQLYKDVIRFRKNPESGEPFQNSGEMFYAVRKIVNSDPHRLTVVEQLLLDHPRAIIFYNFDYELDILKSLKKILGIDVAEWNGHSHQPIPSSDRWAYLVQYTAGAEGWNCTDTDTVIFYSQNYSYKIMKQSAGRTDRLNTPYSVLYYFHILSTAPIDVAIYRCLQKKKNFNESNYKFS